MSQPLKYTCQFCNRILESDWSDDEARAEASIHGDVELAVVCDDCFKGRAFGEPTPPEPPPPSEADLIDLRTRLLKRHAEEAQKELATIDPRYQGCAIAFLAESTEQEHEETGERAFRMTLVTNCPTERLLEMFASVRSPDVIGSRKPFLRGH